MDASKSLLLFLSLVNMLLFFRKNQILIIWTLWNEFLLGNANDWTSIDNFVPVDDFAWTLIDDTLFGVDLRRTLLDDF